LAAGASVAAGVLAEVDAGAGDASVDEELVGTFSTGAGVD
jgi:hypothetical protein